MSSKASRNHSRAWRLDRCGNSPNVSGRGFMHFTTRLSAVACRYPVEPIERDESRRQYTLPGDHLCGGDPRIASVVRLGPEHRDLRRGVVGLCRFAACRVRRAVRHVRFGLRPHLHRSRQRSSVYGVCFYLDRSAGIRSSQAAVGSPVRRRGALARALPRPEHREYMEPACPSQLGHHHCLYLGSGVRILARPQRTAGIALAGHLHAVRPRLALSSAHAVRRHAALGCGEQRMSMRASGSPSSASKRCCSRSRLRSFCWRWPRSAPSTVTRPPL